jgi:hypothetical protein
MAKQRTVKYLTKFFFLKKKKGIHELTIQKEIEIQNIVLISEI